MASFWSNLFEGSNKSKSGLSPEDAKMKKYQDDRVNYYQDNSISTLDQFSVWQLISKLRDLNNPYRYRYGEYDLMSEDTIIQSALELYSDDSTQMDNRTGKIVAIESEDNTLANDLNTLMDSLDIENRIWGWAYDLSKYGDVYLRVHINDDQTVLKLEDMMDPSLIMDLFSVGERINFAEKVELEPGMTPSRNQQLEFYLYGPDDFVHFMIRKSSKCDKFELQLNTVNEDTGEPDIVRYNVVRGTSMLEGVRCIYRVLQLLEDSLLAARIAKAEFMRVFNIEVGDDSTPAQTTDIVNNVKRMFDSKASFDVNTGRYISNKNFRPLADPVFNPVRNGKGSVSHENIGGDFEVKSIVDIDYFNNKLFSGLKIPKVLLGFEDALPMGTDGDVLTQLDVRYSRSVKRVIKGLMGGIESICDIWLKMRGREGSIGKYKVVMRSPSSSEELSRLQELESRVATVNNIVHSVTSNFGEYINVPKVYNILFDQMVDYPEIKEALKKELVAAEKLAEANRLKKTDDEGRDIGPYQYHETGGSMDNPYEDEESDQPDKISSPDKDDSESLKGGVKIEQSSKAY